MRGPIPLPDAMGANNSAAPRGDGVAAPSED
jgi:hypothetical protein